MKIDICYNFFSNNNICTSSPSNKKINIGVEYLILFFTEVSFNIFSQFALHLLNLDLHTINKYFYNCQQNNWWFLLFKHCSCFYHPISDVVIEIWKQRTALKSSIQKNTARFTLLFGLLSTSEVYISWTINVYNFILLHNKVLCIPNI